MVLIDASMLLLFMQPGARGPTDASGNPVAESRKRVEYVISELDRTRTKIAIPTPALSESLIRMVPQEAQRIVEMLNRKAVFSIESFDQRAAIELAVMSRDELGKKLPKTGVQTWAKLKYDRQIVAIAKVCGASEIYSDDEDIEKLGKRAGIPVTSVAQLPLPPDALQTNLMEDLEASLPTPASPENDGDDD